MNMEKNRRFYCHSTEQIEGSDLKTLSVNLKLIIHTRLLCIVRPHTILYMHYKKHNFQPLVQVKKINNHPNEGLHAY